MATAWGTAAEEGARRLAAELGVPDFVYEPVTVPKGRATREVSDGMLIAGDRGLILQVKAKEPSSDSSDDEIVRWVTKETKAATRQVQGTRRAIRSTELQIRSRRGHDRTLKPGFEWPGVVLLSVDRVPPGVVVETEPDSIVMTLDDWFALHDMLLSTTAVIDYVERVITTGMQAELGQEAARYMQFAAADLAAYGSPTSYPALPPERVAGLDRAYAAVLDEWINEDIGFAPVGSGQGEADPDHVRRAVEILDAIPILGRVSVGELLVTRARQSTENRAPRSGMFQNVGHGNVGRVVFFADVESNWPNPQDFALYAATYALVRHEEFRELFDDQPTLMLARLALTGNASMRTFVFVEGKRPEPSIPPEIRWMIADKHGILTPSGVREVHKIVGRNDPCPCRSGRKYKQCHGAPAQRAGPPLG